MAISVVGNFDINIKSPIDSRLVATNSTVRDNIVYKYPGLKVYVLDEDATYVYGTNNLWTKDGGGNQGGGIYGGSGSLPDDVGVYMGPVGATLNNTSNELYHWSGTSSGGYLYNYFYRNTLSKLSYRTEYKLLQASSLVQGPFIEYNGLDSNLNNREGNLVLGTNIGSDTKGKKIVISSDYISFDPSSVSSATLPLTIGQNDSTLYMGWNYNPSGTYLSNNINNDSSRIKFDTKTEFQSRIKTTNTWNTLLEIDNSINPNTTNSLVKLRVDTSAYDWDPVVPTSYQLKTVPEVIRGLEHRFTKLQIWSQGTSYNTLDDNVLLLNPTGNSFTYNFTDVDYIKDIKILRATTDPLVTSDFPNGTIITIRFTNSNQNSPGYLLISDGSNASKIRSNTTDATFTSNQSSNTKLTIKYNTTTASPGDTITFVRITDNWEIVSIDTSFRITNRVWSTGGSTSPFRFNSNSIHYLNDLGTNGIFISNSATITNTTSSNGNPPNKFNFKTGGTQPLNRQATPTNLEKFKFRMSIDGNKIVMVQGNFRVLATAINLSSKFFINRLNVWKVGEITNYSYIPEFETVWTQVSGYMIDSKDIEIPISNASLSINRLGIIFLSFTPTSTSSQDNSQITFDVWVPPFSYQGNITVDAPVGGGGGV